ncbi:hypothetical protein [Ideonella sp. BN130291]|uniref:hypothetical protein n=1 Tax=Ideonella sp. BN130291 TaxID=3112940 RepID=UPI002E273A8D|nr:hypothetical protein [Ideonella sp. BN130291]
MKTLSWTRTPPAYPAGSFLRRTAASSLRAASAVLARLARRLRVAPAPAGARLPVIEFQAFHHEAGAPEGALYVDGELVGFIPVSRL